MIVVICAMDEEKDAVLEKMNSAKKIEDKSLIEDAYECSYNEKDIIVSKCGIGKTNAAINTTVLIKKYNPELIVNLGCAGSLSKDVVVQDTVVASDIAHWDLEIPWPKWERGFDNPLFNFKLDNNVIDIVSKINLKGLHIGKGVTGDVFVYKKEQVDTIKKYYPEALFGEMEGASIAQTCAKFNVACAVIRSISDCTLVNDDYKNFDFNLKLACDNACKILLEIVEKY